MDSELEALRRKRLAELQGGGQASASASASANGSGFNGAPSGDYQQQAQAQAQAQKQEQAEQARQSMLSQILTPEARDRLHRISLVKPDRARYLEDSLIQAVRSGQLRGGTGPAGRISEKDLIGMLEELGEQEEKRKTKIVFQRRRELSSDSE